MTNAKESWLIDWDRLREEESLKVQTFYQSYHKSGCSCSKQKNGFVLLNFHIHSEDAHTAP